MNDDELTRKLNSIGKQIFVKHFALFEQYGLGRITRAQAIDELVKLGVSNKAGAGIRAGNAKLIFEANRAQDALSIIIESNRIPLPVLAEARRLIQ